MHLPIVPMRGWSLLNSTDSGESLSLGWGSEISKSDSSRQDKWEERKKMLGVSAIIQGIGISKAPNQCDDSKKGSRYKKEYRDSINKTWQPAEPRG